MLGRGGDWGQKNRSALMAGSALDLISRGGILFQSMLRSRPLWLRDSIGSRQLAGAEQRIKPIALIESPPPPTHILPPSSISSLDCPLTGGGSCLQPAVIAVCFGPLSVTTLHHLWLGAAVQATNKHKKKNKTENLTQKLGLAQGPSVSGCN